MFRSRLLRIAFPLLALSALTLAGCRVTERVVDPGVEITARAEAPLHASRKASRVEYGPSQRVGAGSARAFVRFGRHHRPEALGVILTPEALGGHPAAGETEYVLRLPRRVDLPPYTHVGLNFNPQGHPPPGIYEVPHFDFHFYTISERRRSRIDGTSGGENPLPQFIPTGYISTVDVVPQMGVHWADPTSSEFQPGGTFTRTMIYGFYRGAMAFVEPMVTVDHLRSGTSSDPVKQPLAFQRAGFYPTNYSVARDDGGRIVVTLEDLKFHRVERSKRDDH